MTLAIIGAWLIIASLILLIGEKIMFENIQKGDRVLMCKHVYTGRRTGKTFLVAEEVTRTTKTQLTVGGKRFMKAGGHEIGDGNNFSFTGKLSTYLRPINDPCGDQTKEYLKFKHERQVIKKAIKFCENAAKFLQNEDHERAFTAAGIISKALQMGAKKEVFKEMTGEK